MEILRVFIQLQFLINACFTMNSSVLSTEDNESLRKTITTSLVSEDVTSSSVYVPISSPVVSSESMMHEHTVTKVQSSLQMSSSKNLESDSVETDMIVYSTISKSQDIFATEISPTSQTTMPESSMQDLGQISHTALITAVVLESSDSMPIMDIKPTQTVFEQAYSSSHFSKTDVMFASFQTIFSSPSSLELKPSRVVSSSYTTSELVQSVSDTLSVSPTSMSMIESTKTATSDILSEHQTSVSLILDSSQLEVSTSAAQNTTATVIFPNEQSVNNSAMFSSVLNLTSSPEVLNMTKSSEIFSLSTLISPELDINSSTISLSSGDVSQNFSDISKLLTTTETLTLSAEVIKSLTSVGSSLFSSEYESLQSSGLFVSKSVSVEPSLIHSENTLNLTSVSELLSTPTFMANMSSSSVWITPSATIDFSSQRSVQENSSQVIAPSKSIGLEMTSISTASPEEHDITTISYHENITCEIRFRGNCDILVNNKMILGEFWEAFIVILSDIFPVKRGNIKPKDITCNPIRLSFMILDVESPNVSKDLEQYVKGGELSVPVLMDTSLKMYTAFEIEFDPRFMDETDNSDILVIGLRQVDIIVISCACLISLILISIGFFICAREYYNKKRTRSFDLSDVVHWNMNLEDYSLTKIPRPKMSYEDKGVRMNSFRRKNGDHSQQLEAQVENVPSSAATNGKVLSDVHVRMNSNSNGLVVGVTGTSEPLLPANQQSPTHSDKSGDRQYDSDDNLCEQSNSPLHSMDNPIYYADDDRFSSV